MTATATTDSEYDDVEGDDATSVGADAARGENSCVERHKQIQLARVDGTDV